MGDEAIGPVGDFVNEAGDVINNAISSYKELEEYLK